jgi:hypothetical protein
MPVLILEQPFVNGQSQDFEVFPDRVRSHLMIIASASQTDFDPSFGDEPVDADGDGTNEASRVLYQPVIDDPGSDAGTVRTNFKALVDRAETTEIYGVGWDWIVSKGGDTSNTSPGIQLGDTVIYDTSQANGAGRWFFAEGDGKKCVMDAEILYHELIHVLRHHGDPAADPDAEEREARVAEGALERALGRPARDPDRPDAGVGCEGEGPCCIVASVATGSPYAPAVSRLRRVRDHALRGGRLGEAWFAQLHREYYALSVPVCRVMVGQPAAREHVERWFVRPLVDALEMAVLWGGQGHRPAAVGGEVLARLRSAEGAGVAGPALRHLLRVVSEGGAERLAGLPLDGGTAEVVRLLAEGIPRAPHVRWAIVDLLDRWAAAGARWELAGAPPEAVGRWWGDQVVEWLAGMPLADAAAALGLDDAGAIRREIEAFGRSVLDGPVAAAGVAALLARRAVAEDRAG